MRTRTGTKSRRRLGRKSIAGKGSTKGTARSRIPVSRARTVKRGNTLGS